MREAQSLHMSHGGRVELRYKCLHSRAPETDFRRSGIFNICER